MFTSHVSCFVTSLVWFLLACGGLGVLFGLVLVGVFCCYLF